MLGYHLSTASWMTSHPWQAFIQITKLWVRSGETSFKSSSPVISVNFQKIIKLGMLRLIALKALWSEWTLRQGNAISAKLSRVGVVIHNSVPILRLFNSRVSFYDFSDSCPIVSILQFFQFPSFAIGILEKKARSPANFTIPVVWAKTNTAPKIPFLIL